MPPSNRYGTSGFGLSAGRRALASPFSGSPQMYIRVGGTGRRARHGLAKGRGAGQSVAGSFADHRESDPGPHVLLAELDPVEPPGGELLADRLRRPWPLPDLAAPVLVDLAQLPGRDRGGRVDLGAVGEEPADVVFAGPVGAGGAAHGVGDTEAMLLPLETAGDRPRQDPRHLLGQAVGECPVAA